ncbi:uncharacterized protein LOC5510344 [Nematostella vectensis]|uniref:uncharacterized protein LOC5510344 n=1 Tax=Nematostella vectensis TaxID=45351 RepID=UPI0020771E5D|nr:uncharacterized protein LOC5510344 [Nematostella vectensis]
MAFAKLLHLVFIRFIFVECCLAELSADPATWPGHLEPLGAKNPKISLESLETFPEPKEFFEKYASKKQPVLFKGGAKLSPAFEKWTDEYFLSLPEAKETKVFAEQGKKENRSNAGKDISFHEFVSNYKKNDIYMVHGVLPFLQKDVLLPPPLQCGEVTKKMLVDTVMWFSSGGTKSVLHNDDVDNINCLFSGTKELLFIDYKYKNKVKIDHPVGGYSGVDVDRVDFTKYPGLKEVQYFNVTMEPGDCLFIPYKWYHQVRSHDRNIAVNVWWTHKPGYVPNDCEMRIEAPFTLDKFYFSALAQQGGSTEGPENLIEHFTGFLVAGDNGKIDFQTFRDRVKMDEVMMGDGKYKWNKQFEDTTKQIFETLDMDGDAFLSDQDLKAVEAKADEVTKKLENLAAVIEDLIEDQNEEAREREEKGTAEGDEPSEEETAGGDEPAEEEAAEGDEPTEEEAAEGDEPTEEETAKEDDPTEEETAEGDEPTEEETAKADEPTEEETAEGDEPTEEQTAKGDEPTEEKTAEGNELTEKETAKGDEPVADTFKDEL